MSGCCYLKWTWSRLFFLSGQFSKSDFDGIFFVAGGKVDGGGLHLGLGVLHQLLGDDEPIFWVEGHEVGGHESAVGIVGAQGYDDFLAQRGSLIGRAFASTSCFFAYCHAVKVKDCHKDNTVSSPT